MPQTRRSPVTRSQLLLRTDVVNAVIGAAPAKRLWLSWEPVRGVNALTLWWGPVGHEDDSLYCHSTNGNRPMWEFLGGMLCGKTWFRGVDEEWCRSAGLLPVEETNG
jgi:hypothetical protein